jgi:hypothetical protein
MKKQVFALVAMTVAASTSFAGAIECSVSEVLAGSLFSQTLVVQENSTEFLTTASKQTKGFVAYTSGQVVINLYDVNESKAKYVVTPLADAGQVSLTFAPEYDQTRTTFVVCKAQQ